MLISGNEIPEQAALRNKLRVSAFAFGHLWTLEMARYLVRRGGTADSWMVWDREKRAPAEVNGRRLSYLTVEQAELALSALTGLPPRSKTTSVNTAWEITYGAGVRLPCVHEVDAKLLARELVKRGHKVTAKTVEGVLPARSIESHQMYAWLRE